ncbi:MAG: YdeI/OmpD-associated family protein [Flavobacteriales bacterium]|nr:YdeI/OmpD-associated family protein [Flavobacteriales bacterium]MCW8911791.1 YdeI/OmpD-associated family protein [Flavobacteriales bacterium]MCW8936438.1 YdeI/OmpD-associated family protein [Flavobacteriales bacterium]MCW8939187.1 YdeI/OmpD-associated family protein [Flavobacteriales bacterium]MCW8967696.1 YdeI/OmpD-associated family protein [Flavobacteriales bacterium]
MNQKVNWFFDKDTKWQKEYQKLRTIILGCGLTEELKWGCPCYIYQSNNIVLIHGFKDYCALLFHKGVLLNDSNKILIQQTENVQSARQIRFTNVDEINDLEQTIKEYVFEAIEVEKAGLEVKMKNTSEYEMPEELIQSFENNPELETAFYDLTPGRQRGYLLYFSQAKQSKTRKDRIEKLMPKIFEGKGYNER